jgi:hypothetical protein
MPPKKKNISFGTGINADRFLEGIHNPPEPEDEGWLGQIHKRDREIKKAKETEVPLPIVGDMDLKVPPFFITKIEDRTREYGRNAGHLIKWRLVNPLTLARTLATRKHKKAINIERQNVDSAEIDMRREEAPKLIEFSQADQKRIINYFEKVKRGETEEYTFKNKPHGFPCYMYKNCEKAGLKKKENTKLYGVNPKKVETGSKVRGRPPTTLKINQYSNYREEAIARPKSVPERPVLEFDPATDIEEVADAIEDWYSKMKDFVPTKEELSRIAKYYNKERNETRESASVGRDWKTGKERIKAKKIYDIYKDLQHKHYPKGHGLDPDDKFSGQGSPENEEILDEMDGLGLPHEEGGALSASDLKGLLGASYDPKIDKVGDFHLDKSISSKTSKVYFNKNTGQAVVAHMGTQGILDWGNNAIYALGGDKAYKMTSRYKEAEKVQKKAESKYGAKNVSTIGHSQGGKQAELLGKNSKEIITLNKATRPFENTKHENQHDIRTTGDLVSALNPFQKKNDKEIEIKSKTYNPLTEHSTDILEGLDKDQMIGQGVIDWDDMKWGSFTEQFKRYKEQHPNTDIEDLGEFAKRIVHNPKEYKGKTLKRARFYLNVISKKIKSPDNNIMPRRRKQRSHSESDEEMEGGVIGLARPMPVSNAVMRPLGSDPRTWSPHPAMLPQRPEFNTLPFKPHSPLHPDTAGMGLGAGIHHHHHYHINQFPSGGDILDDIYHEGRHLVGMGMWDWADPNKNGVAKAFDPKQNGVSNAFEKTFTPQLGRDITSGLIHQALPAVVSGLAGSATTALTGNPYAGFAVGQTLGKVAGKEAGDAVGKATGYGLGAGMRKGRFAKGSKEAKEFMASLRAKKGKGLYGGAIPAPPSRSVITDPTMLG